MTGEAGGLFFEFWSMKPSREELVLHTSSTNGFDPDKSKFILDYVRQQSLLVSSSAPETPKKRDACKNVLHGPKSQKERTSGGIVSRMRKRKDCVSSSDRNNDCVVSGNRLPKRLSIRNNFGIFNKGKRSKAARIASLLTFSSSFSSIRWKCILCKQAVLALEIKPTKDLFLLWESQKVSPQDSWTCTNVAKDFTKK